MNQEYFDKLVVYCEQLTQEYGVKPGSEWVLVVRWDVPTNKVEILQQYDGSPRYEVLFAGNAPTSRAFLQGLETGLGSFQ